LPGSGVAARAETGVKATRSEALASMATPTQAARLRRARVERVREDGGAELEDGFAKLDGCIFRHLLV
jgi:hypothetical protein